MTYAISNLCEREAHHVLLQQRRRHSPAARSGQHLPAGVEARVQATTSVPLRQVRRGAASQLQHAPRPQGRVGVKSLLHELHLAREVAEAEREVVVIGGAVRRARGRPHGPHS